MIASEGRRVALDPAVREIPADTITPIAAYLALAQPGATCLLETIEDLGRAPQQSFIGLDYLETATINQDPAMLQTIRELVGRYKVTDDVGLIGGAVCLFAYDAVRALAPVGSRNDLKVPDVYVIVPGTWLAFDHQTQTIKLIGFARDAHERDLVEQRLDHYILKLRAQPISKPKAVRARGPTEASMSHEQFLRGVAAAKHHIYEGDVYQLQLGIGFSCPVDGSAFDFYRRIRDRNPSPYMFFIEQGHQAVFGASPECLVRSNGRLATIRPLAGTAPRGETPERDAANAAELLASEKERAEHVMLVDLARNDLGKVCNIGSVRVDGLMRIQRFSHVMHIVSDVTGELRDGCDALDLFAASFPAGTVTGAPKLRAMQLIDRLEPGSRGLYAGSVVRLAFSGDLDSCLILRSVVMEDDRAYWQASAGIVADSDAEREYLEVEHKTHIVRHALGIER